MSKASFLKDKEFEWFLSSAAEWLPEAVEDALRAGAAVLAAEMKRNLRGEIADKRAVQLVESFGITPVGQDRNRVWNVHLGFDGYHDGLRVALQAVLDGSSAGEVRSYLRDRDWYPRRGRSLDARTVADAFALRRIPEVHRDVDCWLDGALLHGYLHAARGWYPCGDWPLGELLRLLRLGLDSCWQRTLDYQAAPVRLRRYRFGGLRAHRLGLVDLLPECT